MIYGKTITSPPCWFFFVLYAPYLLIVNVVRFSCNLKEMKLEYSNLDILMADVDDSWFCNITIENVNSILKQYVQRSADKTKWWLGHSIWNFLKRSIKYCIRHGLIISHNSSWKTFAMWQFSQCCTDLMPKVLFACHFSLRIV